MRVYDPKRGRITYRLKTVSWVIRRRQEISAFGLGFKKLALCGFFVVLGAWKKRVCVLGILLLVCTLGRLGWTLELLP